MELSLFMMRSSIFVKICSNNTYMQCSNARLLNSEGSRHLSEVNLDNFVSSLTGRE